MTAARTAWVTALAAAAAMACICVARAAGGDVALGEYLSATCTGCHQASGQTNGIPAIIGWPEDQFIAVVNAYRKGERDNAAMRSIAQSLSSEDMAALAAYFGRLKPNR